MAGFDCYCGHLESTIDMVFDGQQIEKPVVDHTRVGHFCHNINAGVPFSGIEGPFNGKLKIFGRTSKNFRQCFSDTIRNGRVSDH